MKSFSHSLLILSVFFMFLPVWSVLAQDNADLSEEAEQEILIDEGDIGGNEESLIIEDEPLADDADALVIEEDEATHETDIIEDLSLEDAEPDRIDETSGITFHFGPMRLETGALTNSDRQTDSSNYLHGTASARWDSHPRWEIQLSARLDGYYQSDELDQTEADYGESYIRYRGNKLRLTLGTQTVIWGRIDELPPTDRLSVVDLSRATLDDLKERRRAAPVVRLEYFQDAHKLDFVWLPRFREAELPDRDSIWFPINQDEGTILGVPSNSMLQAAVKVSPISNAPPENDGGGGIRYSLTESAFDYALTLQHTRQSTPYYEFDAGRFEARYPRSWVAGGDLGFEAGGATWRIEAAWLSDIPVTRSDLTYTTQEGVNWALGSEFYPGDGDTRVNLQLVGLNLIDAPEILDRTERYTLTGGVDIPFAHNRWRLNTRFFLGLDERDIYLNPELAFIGWEPHEIYLAIHYFDGEDGTLGGFYEDNSLMTLGWRAEF